MFVFRGVESGFLFFVIRDLDLFSPLFIMWGTSVVEGNAMVVFWPIYNRDFNFSIFISNN